MSLPTLPPVEFSAAVAALGRRPGSDLLRDLAVLFQRRDAEVTVFERALRPPGHALLTEVLAEAGGEELREMSADNQAFLLHLVARAGVEAVPERLREQLARSGAMQPGYRALSTHNLLAWAEYVADFAPYIHTGWARPHLLAYNTSALYSADLLARFLSEYVQRLETHYDVAIYYQQSIYLNWFHRYLAHATRREGLPEAYLDTPFHEVIRNIPDKIGAEPPNDRLTDAQWPFVRDGAMFYRLAAGESARALCREAGLSRNGWRHFLRLGTYEYAGEYDHPLVFFWVRGLGGGERLAGRLHRFMRWHRRAEWLDLVQQLIRLPDELFGVENGDLLLGYVYHLLRDQPGFRINVRRPERLLAAARDHAERIAASQLRIVRQRRAAVAAEAEARANGEAARRLKEEERQRQYLARMRKLNWEAKYLPEPYACPHSDYRILEITNGYELLEEGRRMSHCVGSYAHHCQSGSCAILTLRHRQQQTSEVTIRVYLPAKAVVEARGRFNQLPEEKFQRMVNRWAKEAGLKGYRF